MNAIAWMILRHVLRESWAALAGLALWLVALVMKRPGSFEVEWARLLLAFAPLVLVPLGLPLYRGSKAKGRARTAWGVVGWATLPAAAMFGFAIAFMEAGATSALLVAPWLLLTACLALLGLQRARGHLRGRLGELCQDLALVFVVVGSGWALLDRLSIRPLDFDPVIVLLTAIHFHYAGFVLPLVAGVLLQNERGTFARVGGMGVLAGIPLVAVGITTTQLRWGTPLEVVAAWVLGGSGLIVAWLLIRQALGGGPYVRVLWLIAGVSLGGSMVLAILYGSRPFLSVAWLDIPHMRALHGTANALGFALCGLAGARVRQVMGR
jgi:YndJ-like protein